MATERKHTRHNRGTEHISKTAKNKGSHISYFRERSYLYEKARKLEQTRLYYIRTGDDNRRLMVLI